jgi:hypothetical protein
MVVEKEKNGKMYYQCESCNMYYEVIKIAQQCEDFCNSHQACSVELIKHAVNLEEEGKGKTCGMNCKCKVEKKKGDCKC